jgi:hypothetical protein
VPILFGGLAGKAQVGFCFYATKKNQADFINLSSQRSSNHFGLKIMM